MRHMLNARQGHAPLLGHRFYLMLWTRFTADVHSLVTASDLAEGFTFEAERIRLALPRQGI